MNSSIKTALILTLAWLGVFIFAKQVIVKKDNKYPVTYFQQVDREGYESTPAQWKIDISPALSLEKAKELKSYSIMSGLAIFFLILSLIFIWVVGLDLLIFNGSTPRWVLILLLLGYISFEYGAHSSVVSNNYVSVTDAEFQKMTNITDKSVKFVKDNENKDIEKLFDKATIR